MKKKYFAIMAGCAVLGMSSVAHATLTTIGTATYDDGTGAAEYNLIWDDDNNGNSVVWLDYINAKTVWESQRSWAAGLDGQLTYNIDAAYTVTWEDAAWRLPSTVDGRVQEGNDGTTTAGFNITSSEMGHLFYEELGNLGFYDTSGNLQPGWGLGSTGDFENLVADWEWSYWSGTEYAAHTVYAWHFFMYDGFQGVDGKNNTLYGLAVRSGQVSAAAPVPEPSTMLLFGAGIAALTGYGRKKRISS